MYVVYNSCILEGNVSKSRERTWPGNKFQRSIVRGKKLYLNVSVRGNVKGVIASGLSGACICDIFVR